MSSCLSSAACGGMARAWPARTLMSFVMRGAALRPLVWWYVQCKHSCCFHHTAHLGCKPAGLLWLPPNWWPDACELVLPLLHSGGLAVSALIPLAATTNSDQSHLFLNSLHFCIACPLACLPAARSIMSAQLPSRAEGRDRPAAIISPSILSADFAKLAEEAARMTDLGAEWLHVDCMDGHFVPNLTIGAPVVASLRKHTNAYLDCHLMVSNPAQWVQVSSRVWLWGAAQVDSGRRAWGWQQAAAAQGGGGGSCQVWTALHMALLLLLCMHSSQQPQQPGLYMRAPQRAACWHSVRLRPRPPPSHLAGPRWSPFVPQDFASAGANMYCFHLEAVDPSCCSSEGADGAAHATHPDVCALAQQIRAAGMHAGVALRPSTPVEAVVPYLEQGLLDMVRGG